VLFSLCSEGGRGGHGGSARPVMVAVVPALPSSGGGRRPAGLVGPNGQVGRLDAGPNGPKAKREFLSELK
jgi:hypothetical protein